MRLEDQISSETQDGLPAWQKLKTFFKTKAGLCWFKMVYLVSQPDKIDKSPQPPQNKQTRPA